MKEVYITTEAERRYKKAYYEKNREKILQKAKEKRQANPEKNREACKRYRMTHDRSNYFREHNEKNAKGSKCSSDTTTKEISTGVH